MTREEVMALKRVLFTAECLAHLNPDRRLSREQVVGILDDADLLRAAIARGLEEPETLR